MKLAAATNEENPSKKAKPTTETAFQSRQDVVTLAAEPTPSAGPMDVTEEEYCVQREIEELKTTTFDEYTSLRPLTSDETKMIDKPIITTNINNDTIHQQITLYIDNPPICAKSGGNNSYTMGKDAALSSVIKAAAGHVNNFRYTPVNLAVIGNNRENAKNDWELMLKDITAQIEQKCGKKNVDVIHIKALISNFPFVKAIMDSACLGETVCISILYGLCESMRSPENKIVKGLDITKISNVYGDNNFKLLSFLLQMSYCDVFELVSADILGAVNGLYTIRAIHDTLPVVSYVSIPKASGGQIGTDIGVFIIALAITFKMGGIIPEWKKNMPEIPKDIYSAINDAINGVINNKLPNDKNLYIQMNSDIASFRDLLKQCKGGICQTKQDLSKGGICQTENDLSKQMIAMSWRMMNIIKLFGDWFLEIKESPSQPNQRSKYEAIIRAIQGSYNNTRVWFPIIKENIVWVSFQVFRYTQTTKVSGLSADLIESTTTKLESLKTNYKNELCRTLNSKFYKSETSETTPVWYTALKKVAINEAFIGHDNKSTYLLELIREVYGTNAQDIEKQLDWVYDKAKLLTFDKLEQMAILKIQKETKCMFFKWCNIGEVMFCGNSNLVYNMTVGGTGKKERKTANGATVYEIFVNNIGAQRIISTYDLEKYSGQTTMGEVAQSITEAATNSVNVSAITGSPSASTSSSSASASSSSASASSSSANQKTPSEIEIDLTEGIVVERNELLAENDKILEVQGVICALDRASRTSHPRTIYCTGCLNIPITTHLKTTIMTTTLSYKFAVKDDPFNDNGLGKPLPGLHNYKLFTNTSGGNVDNIYVNFLADLVQAKREPQTETEKYIVFLLSYLTEIVNELSADQANKLQIETKTYFHCDSNSNQRGQKRKNQNQNGGVVNSAVVIQTCFKEWFKVYNEPGLSKSQKQFNLLEIVRQTFIKSGKISDNNNITADWKDILYILTPGNKYDIGFIIVHIFNKIKSSIPPFTHESFEKIQPAMGSKFLITTYEEFFTCNINAEIPEINYETAADTKTSQIAAVVSDGSRIGILNEQGNPEPVPFSKIPVFPQADKVTETFKTTEANLLLLKSILPNELYQMVITEAMELTKQQSIDDIKEAIAPSENAINLTQATVDTDAFSSVKSISDQKTELKNQITLFHAIISAIDTWTAQNCSRIGEPSVSIKCNVLDNFKEEINKKLEQSYDRWCKVGTQQGGDIKCVTNYSGKNMRGGTDLDELKGQLVIYKKDVYGNYTVAKYADVFNKYFNVQDTKPDTDKTKEEDDDNSQAIDNGIPLTSTILGGGKQNLRRNVLYNKYMSKLKNNLYIKPPAHRLVTHKFRTRRKKHNVKLTRKKQKKIKARKTRHKAKKHRYTRRNKK